MTFASAHNATSPLEESTVNDCIKGVALLATLAASASLVNNVAIIKWSHKYLWWWSRNAETHFSQYIWDTVVYTDWGGSIDDHRALAISVTFNSHYYINNNNVRDWLHEKWPDWEADPPFWFDDNFKQTISLRLLPDRIKRKEENKRGSNKGPRRWNSALDKNIKKRKSDLTAKKVRRKIVPLDEDGDEIQ